MGNKTRRVALGLMALSMRLDAYAIQRGLTMDASYPKDPDPKNWRTINGSKVHLTEGKIDGGAGGKFSGKEWTGKTKHEFTPKEKETESNSMPNFKNLPEGTQKKLEDVTVHALSGWNSNGGESSKKASIEKANKLLQEFCIEQNITPSQKFEINELVKEFKADMISSNQFKEEVAKYAKCNIGHLAKTKAKPKAAPKPQPTVQKATAVPKTATKKTTTENPKAALTPQGVTKPQAQKVETGAFEQLSSPKQKNNISFLAIYGPLGVGVSGEPEIKGIQKHYGLGDVEVAAIKTVYEELKNKKISKKAFKDTVASIIQYGAVGEIPQPKAMKSGVLQTKGLSKTKLTKATTGVSTPKGTLGLYATEEYKGVIDPAFKNFEEQYGSVQTAKYTKPEKKSVLRYTQGSKHLRDYLCYGKIEGWGEYTKEALQEKVDNISAGLAKMEHPDMWVCRKCTLMDWATKDNPNGVTLDDLKKMKKNGTIFTNAAFLSSTPAEGGTYGDNKIVRHFFVPKKAKGGYIKSVSAYQNENEFLLDKGTKTRIMKVEKKDGKIVTYEEVVLDED